MKKGSSNQGRCFLFFLLTGLCLLLLDVASKYFIYYHFPYMQHTTPFYPYGGIAVFQGVLGIDFCINRVTNLGGAWGIFSSYPIVLLIVRIATFFSLLIFTLFLNDQKKRRIPLFLIIVGALGNILDSFFYGSVIDMFHFVLWGYSFPVFNFADTMIFLGVVSLAAQSLFRKKKKYEPVLSNQSP